MTTKSTLAAAKRADDVIRNALAQTEQPKKPTKEEVDRATEVELLMPRNQVQIEIDSSNERIRKLRELRVEMEAQHELNNASLEVWRDNRVGVHNDTIRRANSEIERANQEIDRVERDYADRLKNARIKHEREMQSIEKLLSAEQSRVGQLES